jgi:predicted enzyme involved in methoxymalonyl-ACP biosynthesis
MSIDVMHEREEIVAFIRKRSTELTNQAQNVETWGFEDFEQRVAIAKEIRAKAEALAEMADDIENYRDI